MSKEFKFNAAEVSLQAPVQVEGSEAKQFRVVEPRSDTERITAARAIAVQHDRESNADPTWGGLHRPEFFQDYGHGSGWLARHILFMAQAINTPAGLIHGQYLRDSSSYNPSTGVFETESSPLSLVDLTVAFKLQIHALGLSQVLIEEWAAQIQSLEEDRAFYAKDFAGRMATFREKA